MPTVEQIENADRMQLCKWHRFLPLANNEEELAITNRIYERYKDLGGMTPTISKAIGW